MTLTQLFTAIANAIRTKKGTSGTITASSFPTEIASITTGIDTSDANAVANDIVTGKTAYVNNVKLTGTYTGIVPTGTKQITQNGTVDVTNYASANVNVPTPSPTLQSKSIEITENGTQTITADTGYDGLSSVEVTTNISGGVPDWSQIGYNETPSLIIDAYNYSKTIYDNWNNNITSMNAKYQNAKNLVYFPLVDTSHVTDMRAAFFYCTTLEYIPSINTSSVTTLYQTFAGCSNLKTICNIDTSSVTDIVNMFQNCTNLKNVPIFNWQSVTSIARTFSNCTSLSDESLNNILASCITATSYTGTKTLAQLGFSSSYYSASRIQSLNNYQDFIDAGWTIGY